MRVGWSRRVDWPTVLLAVVVLVVVALFGNYLNDRRHVSDERQAGTNHRLEAELDRERALDGRLAGTHDAVCTIFHQLPAPPAGRFAGTWRRAHREADCATRLRHPKPASTAPAAPSDAPQPTAAATATVTVTRTAHPQPGPTVTVTKPSCTGPVRVGRVCVTPVPTPTLPLPRPSILTR